MPRALNASGQPRSQLAHDYKPALDFKTLTGNCSSVKNGNNPRRVWSPIIAAAIVSGAGGRACVSPAQVSLRTVVELAQRNSSAVRLAEADVKKAQAALAQTQDAYIPNFVIGSQVGYSHGFPTGQPSVGSATMQSLVLSYSQRQYTKAARAGIDAANLSLKDASEQVALDASTTYIELDTVNRELAAARQQQSLRRRPGRDRSSNAPRRASTPISTCCRPASKPPSSSCKRLHLETRAATLAKQLAVLTGLPVGSILPDHASIPEIPAVTADEAPRSLPGIDAASCPRALQAVPGQGRRSCMAPAPDRIRGRLQLRLQRAEQLQHLLQNFTPNNVSFGLQITVPFFDFALRAKAKVTAAEALRATVEAEQAQRQNDVQIATFTGSLRELDAQAEIASLKQQIADEQLKTVLAQLELGNGAGTGPGAQPQVTPKAEQLARIDERQKFEDALDAGLDLSKARLEPAPRPRPHGRLAERTARQVAAIAARRHPQKLRPGSSSVQRRPS